MRKLLSNAIQSAIESGADIGWAPHYCEPGYECDGDGVYLSNWNPRTFTPLEHTIESRIGAILEREGVSMGWSDEWATCDACQGAVRTQPNSYSWTPSFVIDECTITCHECWTIDDQEEYLINDPSRADTMGFDWASRGWACAETHETGFHPGQDGDPGAVYDRLSGEHDVLFTIDTRGQFDTCWSAWIRDPN